MHFSNFILILLCHIHSYLPFNSELPEDTEERRKFLMKEFDNVFETYKDSSSRCIALIPCQFCFFFFLSDFFFIIFLLFQRLRVHASIFHRERQRQTIRENSNHKFYVSVSGFYIVMLWMTKDFKVLIKEILTFCRH